MKDETVGSILKKAAKKENELYLLYKNAEKCVKDAHIKTILKRFAREELEHEQALKNFNIDGLKKQKIEVKIHPRSRWLWVYPYKGIIVRA